MPKRLECNCSQSTEPGHVAGFCRQGLETYADLYRGGMSIQDIANNAGISKTKMRDMLISAGVEFDRAARISTKNKGRPSSRKGAVATAETRLKMSLARKGKPGKRGFKFSAESRSKMSATRKRLCTERPELMERLRAAPRGMKKRVSGINKLRQKIKTYLARLLKMPRSYTTRRLIESVVGYTKEDLLARLKESKSPGVDLSDRSSFHIDHITPIEHFYANGIYDLRVINALDNLQALTPAENRAKGTKVPI